jgi:hypothetical protein
MTVLFGLAIGLGAFLLFVIQPEVGKLVLPLLGGTPAVWNTCLVFFQLALLGGYLYAHLIGRLGLRAQVAIHISLMAIAGFVLPVTIHVAGLQSMAERPALWLFGVLIARVAAPYIVAAATAPLLQRWWASTAQATAHDPYFLYAASNAGSLLALLTYPTLIEPALTLAHQSLAWTAGYVASMALMATAGLLAWRRRAPAAAALASGTELGNGAAEPLTWRRRLRWFVLSAVPVVIMLGATTHITTDVAAVPLLWVLPLSVYLSTFILAFATRQIISPRWASTLLPVAVMPPLLAVALSANGPWLPLLATHLLGLFFAALVCHGALARDRPSTTHLTEFYLWIAAGGALGGLLTTLGAPLVFTSILEYPIGLLAACLLRPDVAAAPVPAPASARDDAATDGIAFAATAAPAPATAPASARAALTRDIIWIAAVALVALASALLQPTLLPDWTPGIALALPLVLVITQYHRPRRFALALAAALVTVALLGRSPHRDIFLDRNFFGVVRVRATEVGEGALSHPVHLLLHGNILHGMQAVNAAWQMEPGSYYGRRGPVGQLFLDTPAHDTRARVGVVGLGIGALIAYGRPSERWTFFEINPTVVHVATDRRYFTYLADTPVPHDIVLGEGRLAVAQQPDASFDLLVLDAFSSDAIPTHLVTREAVAMYFRKLKPDGVLLVNVSNRFVSLQPVLGAIARDEGLAGRQQGYVPTDQDRDLFPAEWVVLAKDERALGPIAGDGRWQALPESGAGDGRAAWTDDYSSLVSVLKWRR